MDISAFSQAIDEIASSKGLSREIVIEALRESIKKAYIKHLGGGDDALVEVNIDPDTFHIVCRQLKTVVKEVNDDYLEIDIEEANAGKKKNLYKEGDLYPIECSASEMSKVFAKAVQNNFRSKLAEAERFALYDIYKDHIGEMITGTVEKFDDRSCFVNIGRTTVELTKREMIGDETFRQGDPIKVYIQEVRGANDDNKGPRGPQIEVTRSSEGFLKRLFEEEIHEIFEGTVVIKAIAREAGVRSKVAVYSKVEDIDATGACIGAGGSRIQKIVSQLGNSHDREKIDIISWSPNPGLFVAESLRPAQVLGVYIEEEQEEGARPRATAIVRDEQLSLAIGKKGANARLANKLTGWNIDIVEESIAKEDQLEYVSVEELMKEAEEEAKIAERAAFAKKVREEAAKATPVKEEEITFVPSETKEEEVKEGEEETVPEVKEEVVVQEKPAVAEPTLEVKTTTTLEALEKELEQTKSKASKPDYSKNKRPRKITEEEVQHVKPTEVVPTFSMPIYSQEELDEIEAEENALAEEESYLDEDLDQYDDYYEE